MLILHSFGSFGTEGFGAKVRLLAVSFWGFRVSLHSTRYHGRSPGYEWDITPRVCIVEDSQWSSESLLPSNTFQQKIWHPHARIVMSQCPNSSAHRRHPGVDSNEDRKSQQVDATSLAVRLHLFHPRCTDTASASTAFDGGCMEDKIWQAPRNDYILDTKVSTLRGHCCWSSCKLSWRLEHFRHTGHTQAYSVAHALMLGLHFLKAVR